VNEWEEEKLAEIFRRFGEESAALRIARAIAERRKKIPFETTGELAEFIATLMPRRGKIHPATRVFQALRIAVNDELGVLERTLPQTVDLLAPGGRLAVISFHSLEDRIVKQFMRRKEKDMMKIVNKKVIIASREEIKTNPRARSAKLRVLQK
jgi:16S rRNA (cytosine1402-N4)-methyltransferase